MALAADIEPPAYGTQGRLHVSFDRTEAVSHIASLYQQAPLRLMTPRPIDDDSLAGGVLVNTAGGIVGGDTLHISVTSGPGARAALTSQAAEKVYRSAGPEACLAVELDLAAESWTEWLPHETILFDKCRLRRSFTVTAAPTARLLAGDLIVFGRTAMKEQLTQGLFHDTWSLRLGGKLIWTEAMSLDGDIAKSLDAPAGFDGAICSALLLYMGADAGDFLDTARQAAQDHCGPYVLYGATCLPQLLILRFLSPRFDCLRAAFGNVWGTLRHAITDLAPQPPRNWTL